MRKNKAVGLRTRRMVNIKIAVFFTVIGLLFILGLLIPLRPTGDSVVEKRPLAKYPEFSFQALMDGSYFKQVDLWFSDTFPFRDDFVSANTSFKGMFGVSTAVVHGDVNKGDDIPDVPKKPAPAPSKAPSSSQAPSSAPSSEAPSSEPSSEEEPVDVPTQSLGAVLIAGDSAYEYYNFSQSVADEYAGMVNGLTQTLAGKATVYDIVVPTSMDITLPSSVREGLNTDDQKKATDYIYGSMLPEVKTVPIFDTLKNHKKEYIYFRTDHHWTALGAYYAYEEFAKSKGVPAVPLSKYQTVEYPDFLGAFYADTEKNPALTQNVDTIVAYIPPDTNSIVATQSDGNDLNWDVVHDVSDYAASMKYSCFIAGDNPFSTIENPNKQDGSACVVVKESFGNAFVPFLISHYQTVYVVDYRYWEGSISSLVAEKGIQDVILMNNISATRSSSLVGAMETVVN